MQNRYVGDIGDYGKYGLLRALCHPACTENTPDLNLGIAWCLVPDEKKGNDGRFVGYLNKPKGLECCDPALFATLKRLVDAGDRNVRAIKNAGLFNGETVFFEEVLTFEAIAANTPAGRQARVACRKAWWDSALAATHGCDVVFFDPDNGLVTDTTRYQRKGPKFVHVSELAPFVERQQSLVVYHHLHRHVDARTQILDWSKELYNRYAGFGIEVHALRYHRGPARAFFVIVSKSHSLVLRSRIERFGHGPWGSHFNLVEK